MVLDKKGLLKEMALKTETITLDSGDVLVKEVNAVEYMEVYNSPAAKDTNGEFDGSKFTALLVTHCIVDAKGQRLFDDADADTLRAGSTSVYTKMARAVNRVNGLGTEIKN